MLLEWQSAEEGYEFNPQHSKSVAKYSIVNNKISSQVWKLMPVISTIRKLRQENSEFKANLKKISIKSLKTSVTRDRTYQPKPEKI